MTPTPTKSGPSAMLNVRLKRSLYERAQRAAQEEGDTLQGILRSLLITWLRNRKQDKELP